MTNERLAKIARLATLATPAPWRAAIANDGPGERTGVYSAGYSDEEPGVCGHYSKGWPITREDAEYIAACDPDTIAAMCAELTELRALTHGAHADTARLDAKPNYEAGVKAYHETARYWAPELMASPAHIAQIVERIVDAATRSTPENQA